MKVIVRHLLMSSLLLISLIAFPLLSGLPPLSAASCQPVNETSWGVGYLIKSDGIIGTWPNVIGLGGDILTYSPYGSNAGGIMYVLSVILPDSSVLQLAVYVDSLAAYAWYGTTSGWYIKFMGYLESNSWYTLNIYYDNNDKVWKFSYQEVDPTTRQSVGSPVIATINDLRDKNGNSPSPPPYTNLDSNQISLIVESYNYNEKVWNSTIYWLHMGISVFTTYDAYPGWYWTLHGYLYSYCIENSPDYGTKILISGGGIVPNWIKYTFILDRTEYWLSDFYIGPYEEYSPITNAGQQLY